MKQNCWEFKKCGREQGGSKSRELGVCPSSTEISLNGSHDGRFGGRSCWVVAGTMCGGKEQGTFAQKFHNCEKCDFYQSVKKEEGGKFTLSIVLINKMKQVPTVLQAAQQQPAASRNMA